MQSYTLLKKMCYDRYKYSGIKITSQKRMLIYQTNRFGANARFT
jgi:hypothetical protein